jgi:hypothetical protein
MANYNVGSTIFLGGDLFEFIQTFYIKSHNVNNSIWETTISKKKVWFISMVLMQNYCWKYNG